MAKLYFRYGTVGSAKTLNLLAVAHNYRQQGKEVVLLKPELDTRFGAQKIASRAGLVDDADLLVSERTVLNPERFRTASCVLVDEAQFLAPTVIEQLRQITLDPGIPVICYGLRTDFRSRLFEGSKRLLELADSIEEIKNTCAFCNRKAVVNLKHIDGAPSDDGPTVDLGSEEKYLPACFACYQSQLAVTRSTPRVANS
jgi:thymidine kinase